ncbi:hypothetical protein GGX14DRAFT_396032 [Mycena pura]|uniref:Ricin B lectin domain-containing protein n=1 Tax=Mycena pura TaxID=153505 RepID=A0AAD6YA07_9AGAR|nr:hypothetical protein GGX14DRAFT_396032 [Mycena pura]
MKAISLTVVAAGLFAAVGASALARRTSPDPDAAAAFVLIQPFQSPTLCITATGANNTNPTILSPCDPSGAISFSQVWAVTLLSTLNQGANVVQFQNVGNNACLSEFTTVPPKNGVLVTMDPCVDVNGNSLSGTRFDPSQAITQSKLPLLVTSLNSLNGGNGNTGFCLDRAGNQSVVLNACSGSLSQSWLISAL